MVGWWVVLCEIIGFIGGAAFPMHSELALADSISNPIESHVHCFGSFGFNSVVGDAFGDCVVGLNWGWAGLRMAHFGKDGATVCSFLSIDVECACLCFGSRAHYGT